MQFVLHVDIDAFFPSVEKILHPELKNLPLAIGKKSMHGVVTSACYIARKFGIHAGMNNFQALKLCSNLVFRVSSMDIYKSYSKKFQKIITYNALGKVLIGSVDEVYVICNKQIKGHQQALSHAKHLQSIIKEKMQIDTSIGISNNAFLAKMATYFAKPKKIFWIYPYEVKEKLWPLPIEKFFGIGKTKIPQLHELNIFTIRDFAKLSKDNLEMSSLFGSTYLDFWNKAQGHPLNIDGAHIIKSKSVGISRTFLIKPPETLRAIIEILNNLISELHFRLNEEESTTSRISIQFQNKEHKKISHQISLKTQTNDIEKISLVIKKLFFQFWNEKPLEFLGISLSNLEKIANNTIKSGNNISQKIVNQSQQIKNIIQQINHHYQKVVLFEAHKLPKKIRKI